MATILLVESDPEQIRLIGRSLRDAGHEVLEAHGVIEANHLLLKRNVDLIACDVHALGGDGFDYCHTLKTDPDRKAIPLIAITKIGSRAEFRCCAKCPADSFVFHPIDAARLVSRVTDLLGVTRRRPKQSFQLTLELSILGESVTVTSDLAQLVGFLATSVEELVRTNADLQRDSAAVWARKMNLETHASRLESLVRASDEKYQGVMDASTETILIIDMEGKILELNSMGESMLELPRDKIMGRPLRDVLRPADRDAFSEHLRTLFEAGRLILSAVERRHVHGRPRFTDISATVVKIGASRFGLVACRDVEGCDSAQDQAPAFESGPIGAVAAGIAREFADLLTLVQGYGDRILSGLKSDDPLREDAERMSNAVLRSIQLTRHFQALGRGRSVRHRVVEINAVVESIQGILRTYLGSRCELVLRLAATAGTILVDPVLLDQLLLRLSVRARETMAEGGQFVLETSSSRVSDRRALTERGIPPGEYTVLSVSEVPEHDRHDTRSCGRLAVTPGGSGPPAPARLHRGPPAPCGSERPR